MTGLRFMEARDLPLPPRPEPPIVALDVGQRNDYSALAIVQRVWERRPAENPTERARTLAVYNVVNLDRTRQESYETVVDAVAGTMRRPELAGAILVVDETGIGTAIGDMLDARGLWPERVTIHGGSAETSRGQRHSVPKRNLATIVAVLLESRRLRVAERLPLASTLRDELANFRVTVSAAGHDSYGAGEDWRQGNNDDLLLAVAMACWWGEREVGSGSFASW